MYLLGQENVDVNIKGKHGYTLLHTACKKINNLPLNVFKLLIETHGADVNVQDKYNNTSVCLAFGEFNPHNGGDITVLAYLLNQNNVNLNITSEKGCNLLHSACTNNLPSYRRSVELDAEYDTIFCQIVEDIIERLAQQVLDETTPLEATTTM
jgi:ankyrin repeat protein